VKTYAHSLRLSQERLEDTARKRHELERAIARKREELLAERGRNADVAARSTALFAERTDAREALRPAVPAGGPASPPVAHELAQRMANYVAPELRPEAPANVVRLGRKDATGRIVRLPAPGVSAAQGSAVGRELPAAAE
jgi:hypothetical protein